LILHPPELPTGGGNVWLIQWVSVSHVDWISEHFQGTRHRNRWWDALKGPELLGATGGLGGLSHHEQQLVDWLASTGLVGCAGWVGLHSSFGSLAGFGAVCAGWVVFVCTPL